MMEMIKMYKTNWIVTDLGITESDSSATFVGVELNVINDQNPEDVTVIFRTTVYLSPPADDGSFIPLNQLTQDMVIKWAIDVIGVQESSKHIAYAECIARQHSNTIPIRVSTFPWNDTNPLKTLDDLKLV